MLFGPLSMSRDPRSVFQNTVELKGLCHVFSSRRSVCTLVCRAVFCFTSSNPSCIWVDPLFLACTSVLFLSFQKSCQKLAILCHISQMLLGQSTQLVVLELKISISVHDVIQ